MSDSQSADTVLENRKHFTLAVAGKDIPLITLRQVHSDRIIPIYAKSPMASVPEGDALVTTRSGVLLAVQTADCFPVFVVDPTRKAVAAIHAGWRGILKRIPTKTVEQMQKEYFSIPAECLAIIGPGIKPCCYEVGEEVFRAFFQEFSYFKPFSQVLNSPSSGSSPKRFLDLAAAVEQQLLESGLLPGRIFKSALCTCCRTDLFFSYRAEAGKTGRMMAAIGIRDNYEEVS